MRIIRNPLLFPLIFVVLLTTGNLFGQTLTVNTGLCGCQPGAGTPCPGNTNYLMCTFAFNITAGCPSFTAINNFTTSGTYLSTDILNFKLYETNFSVFNTSTLVATIAAGLGPGAHTFSGFNRTNCAAVQRYYWITCDFSPAAVAGRTIRVDLITAGMYAITGTVNYGTNTAAGTQTICNTLPVELLSFTGKNVNGNNVLEWQTSSETNNDYFTVEKSTDGITFFPIARIDGAGNSTQINDYSFTDENSAALTYYRLRQTDFNGRYEYPGGVLALNNESLVHTVSVAVSDNTLFVQHLSSDAGYEIFDLSGRSCLSGTLHSGDPAIPLSGLPRGTYLLRLNDAAITTRMFSKLTD